MDLSPTALLLGIIMILGSNDKASKEGCYTIERFSEHICHVDDLQ